MREIPGQIAVADITRNETQVTVKYLLGWSHHVTLTAVCAYMKHGDISLGYMYFGYNPTVSYLDRV